jgi:peptide/nickel transport system permease protein
MLRFLTVRIGQSLGTVVTVVVGVFLLGRLTGDPTPLLLPPTASDEARALVREKYGLDEPVWVQLYRYVGDVLHGDLGTSIWRAQPVSETVLSTLPATLSLGALVFAIAVPSAFVLGTIGGRNPEGRVARLVSLLGAVAASVADFWIGLLLIWLVAFQLGWLPSGGGPSLEAAVLPALTLCLYPMGVLSQVVRASVERERLQVHVRAAVSRGLSPGRVARRYVVRNALTPSLAVAGTLVISLINGVVVIETIFGWPGIGNLLIGSIRNRDFPLLQGVVLVTAVITFLVNLIVDLMIAALDPRIRHAGQKGVN